MEEDIGIVHNIPERSLPRGNTPYVNHLCLGRIIGVECIEGAVDSLTLLFFLPNPSQP